VLGIGQQGNDMEAFVDTGRDFLRAQVNNAIAQHQTLVDGIESHARQADDRRYRELCQRYLPRLISHQHMLEDYGRTIGAGARTGLKEAFGTALGKARDAVDALRESDFLRVVEDVVMIRQAQDTFAAFGAVGERIGEPRLGDIGHECEREHDTMQREFNELVRTLFVEQVLGGQAERADQPRTELRPG
jgi:hypothetical protein